MFSIHELKRKRNKLLILRDSFLESLGGYYLVEILTANTFKSTRWVLPSTKGLAFVLIVCKIFHRWVLKKKECTSCYFGMAVRRLPALLGKLLFFFTSPRHLSLNPSWAILTELSSWSLFSSRGFTNLSMTIIFLSSPAVTPTNVLLNFVNVN